MVRCVAVPGPVFAQHDVYVTVRRVVAHVIDLLIEADHRVEVPATEFAAAFGASVPERSLTTRL
jgi:hypothetical protein